MLVELNNKTENDLWIQWTHNTLVRQGVGYQLFLIRPGFCVDIRGEALKNSTQKFTHILITNVGEALVTDNLGPSHIRFIRKMNGLQHKRNRIELRGNPVLTPPKTSNRKDPSPMPEEKAVIEV